jgi:hypothetical protein
LELSFLHFLMHWMSVKLPDNFQMREHSWPCRFHIIYSNNCIFICKLSEIYWGRHIFRADSSLIQSSCRSFIGVIVPYEISKVKCRFHIIYSNNCIFICKLSINIFTWFLVNLYLMNKLILLIPDLR